MNRALFVLIAACLLHGCASTSEQTEQTGAGVFPERESDGEWQWQQNERERELRERSPTKW